MGGDEIHIEIRYDGFTRGCRRERCVLWWKTGSRVGTRSHSEIGIERATRSVEGEGGLTFRKLRTAADPAAWKLGEIEGEDNAAQLRMIAVVALRRAYILGVFERGWTAEERIERGMVVR